MHRITIHHLASASIAIVQACKLGLDGATALILHSTVKWWEAAWRIQAGVHYRHYHILQILGLKETLILITWRQVFT